MCANTHSGCTVLHIWGKLGRTSSSSGGLCATGRVVDLVERRQHPGAILHWFLGATDDVARAVRAGAYFSVSTGMNEDLIAAIPRDRILTETDFPARQVRALAPGATSSAEDVVGRIWRTSQNETRYQLWTNLKSVAIESGAIDAVSDSLADALLAI